MAGLLQAAAALVLNALEHDASGTAALLAAAPLSELAAGGQLHGVVTGALSNPAAIAVNICCVNGAKRALLLAHRSLTCTLIPKPLVARPTSCAAEDGGSWLGKNCGLTQQRG